jgi:hypothetical protein
MASLRRKPTPDVSEPINEAAEILKGQIDDLRRAADADHQRHEEPSLSADARRREWLEATPAARENPGRLNDIHKDILGAGFADTSPAYFEAMEERLVQLQNPPVGAHVAEEMKQHVAARKEPPPEQSERAGAAHFSAPVSRDAPSYSARRPVGPVRLSAEQREFAKVAGVSESEYATQLERLRDLKDAGAYP